MKFKMNHKLDLDKKTLELIEETDYEMYGFQKQITRRIIDLEEEVIKEALIKLGWTPPSELNYCYYTYSHYNAFRPVYKSECGKQVENNLFNFCPHCGKKILGEMKYDKY